MAPGGTVFVNFLHLLYFSTIFNVINCFNLDTKIPIIKTAPIRDTYFGYSVALHRITAPNPDGSIPYNAQENIFLVGAPDNNMAQDRGEGALYRCPMTTYQTDCQKIVVDPSASDSSSSSEERFDQWLGVTVTSQGPGKKVMVCAHRFKILGRNYKWGVGMCYVMTGDLNLETVQEPCMGQPYDNGHEEFGFCQAGTSAQFTVDDNMVIGTPGPYYWRGGIFKITSSDVLGVDKYWYHSTVVEKEDDTKVPPVKINSYLGYSVTSGYILNEQMTYVAGAPRSNDTGQVVLFLLNSTSRILDYKPEHILSGDQFGSSFGFSLAALDVNGDKLTDLVVGAPFYHDKNVGGQIYVYLNSASGISRRTEPIKIPSRLMSEGECKQLRCENARFGNSLADLGDIDRDGYSDLAVGAPYEGTGVVYIFNGGKDGLQRTPSQRISADDVQGLKNPSSFGHSLSGKLDMDGNTYPDLLVGSFQSEAVVLLRARPVVRLISEIEKIPEQIDTERMTCPDGRSICFKLKMCFKFTAEPRDKFAGEINVRYKVEAEKYEGGARFSRIVFANAKDNVRRYIVEGGLTLFNQARDQLRCMEEDGHIDPSSKDLLNPIHFKVSYGLEPKEPAAQNPGDAMPNIDDYPAFNKMDAEKIVVLDFVKNCGPDQVCHSDLVIEARPEGLSPDLEAPGSWTMTLGKQQFVKLDFTITNKNEDAHAAEFYMTIPKGLSVKKQEKIACSQTANRLQCNVGNPLAAQESREFSIEIFTHTVKVAGEKLEFDFLVNTTSVELNPSDNERTIVIRPIIEADLFLRGGASPDQLFYGGQIKGEQSMVTEEDIGSALNHTYEVINRGPGNAAGVSVEIDWPYEMATGTDESGKYLLYIVKEPQVVTGNGRCVMKTGQVNPLNVLSRAESVSLKTDPPYTVADERKRIRRAVKPVEVVMPGGKRLNAVKLACDGGEYATAKCFRFHCELTEIQPNQRATIIVRARLWNGTFVEDYPTVDSVLISSRAEIVLDPRYRIKQDVSDDKASAMTVAYPDVKVAAGDEVPLWIILVAIACGLLILLILVLLLWCFGFFRRTQAPKDERYLHKATVKKHKSSDDW